jgi:ATP-binding cassette subfamily F protein uup
MIVSHDRYFMDKLVDHLFAFVGDGKIKDIPGNYGDFHISKLIEKQEKQKVSASQKVPEKPTDNKPKNNRERKMSFKEKEEFTSLDQELENLEKKKNELSEQLGNSELSGEELNRISMNLSEIVALLDEKTNRWLELSELAN